MESGKAQRLEGGRRILSTTRSEPPLISIIVVIFRAKDEIQNILDNLFTFDPDAFELIVIDGGSQDGTVDILRQKDDKIDYWLSEPDSGIYDAMNKGLASARGGYILHLNEGDRLKLIPHGELASCLEADIDVACFSVLISREAKVFRPRTGFWLRIGNTWHHQGTFYRRSRHLGYDPRYRIFGDFDLNQRMLKRGRTVRLYDRVVAETTGEGISSSGAGIHEIYRSIRNNFGLPYVALSFLRFKYRGLRYRTARALAWLHLRR